MNRDIWTSERQDEIAEALSHEGRVLLAIFLCERMANTLATSGPPHARTLLAEARRELLDAASTPLTATRAAERYAELSVLFLDDLPGVEDYATCLAFGFHVLHRGDLVATASIIGRVLDYVGAVAEDLDPEADVASSDLPLIAEELRLLDAAIGRASRATSPLAAGEVQREVDEAREHPVPSLAPA